MAIEPQIIRKAFSLVGAESAIDFGADFGPALQTLYERVSDKLGVIDGLAEPARMVGYWHMCDMPSGGREYRYFAGVEAESADLPVGLIKKKLPESLYAVFTEARRGTVSGPEGYAYKEWLPASGYDYNGEIPGDFEIFRNMTDTGPECEAEIWIPVALKAR